MPANMAHVKSESALLVDVIATVAYSGSPVGETGMAQAMIDFAGGRAGVRLCGWIVKQCYGCDLGVFEVSARSIRRSR